MNKRERVLSAMDLLPVDRPPVGFWFHFAGEKAVGQACIDAHLDYYNHIDVDFAKVMCDSYFTFPFPEEMNAPSDLKKLKPLDKTHPFIQEQLARAKGVKLGLEQDMCVFYNIFAPFSLIRFGSSTEFIMKALREDPEAVVYALSVIAKDSALLSELMITEAGMDGIYYCVQGGEHDRMSYEQYREYITPSDKYVLEHVNQFSRYNILHCCGWAGVKNRLEVWKDYPAKTVNWAAFVEELDLDAGKEFFGGKAVLGGFDNRENSLILNRNKEAVQAYTKELVKKFGQNGLLIGADCTLPATVDRQRISWVVDAAKGMAK